MSDPMTKDAPAFDFYPERWLAGVADMSDKDQLAYLRLLCHAWMRDGLPDDTAILTRLAGGKVSAGVMAKFPLNQDGKRRNPRLEVVRLEQRERIASRRFGSAVTNLKRHGADSLSESDRAMLEASERGRSMLANASLSGSLACRSATLERVASESPPPTTHHPPHLDTDREREPQAREAPCTEAEAFAFAKNLPVTPAWTGQAVAKWYSTREATGWTRSGQNPLPITKETWRADLRSSHGWATIETKPNGNHGHRSSLKSSSIPTRNTAPIPRGPSLNRPAATAATDGVQDGQGFGPQGDATGGPGDD